VVLRAAANTASQSTGGQRYGKRVPPTNFSFQSRKRQLKRQRLKRKGKREQANTAGIGGYCNVTPGEVRRLDRSSGARYPHGRQAPEGPATRNGRKELLLHFCGFTKSKIQSKSLICSE
jgi:hypothetical protein